MHTHIWQQRWAALPVAIGLAGLAVALLFLLLTPRAAQAAGVVSTCDQPNLEAALAGGGEVTFDCGGPATIVITPTLVITQDTTIDGGAAGLVTLSGGNATQIMSATPGVTLRLVNLTLRDGFNGADSSYGGALTAAGPTSISHSTFISNGAESGGAVYVYYAPVTVTDSLFQYNVGSYEGGALNVYGSLDISGSEFYSNTSDYSGAIVVYGALTMRNSSVHHNWARYSGGGIEIYDLSTLSAVDSQSPQGSPYAFSLLTEVDIYSNVVVTGYGGGIDFESYWIGLDRVRIYDNRIDNGDSNYAGAGLSVFYGTAVLTDSAVYNNVAVTGPGGGIHASYGATLTVNSSAIYNNRAEDGAGGGISLRDTSGGAWLFMYNSTVSGNSSTVKGGGIDMDALYNYAVISYTTLYSNAAPLASTITGTVEAHASLFAGGQGGPNCGWILKSYGYNLDDANSCGLGATGDLTTTNPLLDDLLWNGGPTLTHALLEGSPAIDAGDPAICPPADQRGGQRPFDGDGVGGVRCDIGAFEFGASLPRLFLPLLLFMLP